MRLVRVRSLSLRPAVYRASARSRARTHAARGRSPCAHQFTCSPVPDIRATAIDSHIERILLSTPHIVYSQREASTAVVAFALRRHSSPFDGVLGPSTAFFANLATGRRPYRCTA